MAITRTLGWAALLIVGVHLAACGKQQPQPGQTLAASTIASKPNRTLTSARQIKKSEMTPAEQKYGIAPIPDSTVTYQPDVIIVGGGAEAIRSQSATGFIWTIDGSAPHADELVPGKVLFMTNRAVGRVLDVRKQGADLVVTLGPADLTDVFKELHVHVEAMPIDFGEALQYTLDDLPGRVVPLAQTPMPARAMPAAFIPTMAADPFAPGAQLPPGDKILDHFTAFPVVSTDGIGIHASTESDGLKVSAQVNLQLVQPTVGVTIDISLGGVNEASLTLGGASGLTWTFDAGNESGFKGNANGLIQPNTDISIPFNVAGVPLAISVRQRFLVKTGFVGSAATISAKGDYTIGGAIKMGYYGKKWQISKFSEFHENTSIAGSTTGISMSHTGVSFGHALNVIVGFGAAGFTAGPYVSLSSAAGASKTSDIDGFRCTTGELRIDLMGGVGYTIPPSIKSIINAILSIAQVKHRIEGEGALVHSDWYRLVTNKSKTGGCSAGTPAATT